MNSSHVENPSGEQEEMSSNVSMASEQPNTSVVSRRPMNAFLLFCKRHRTVVKEMYPNLENRNITKILGEWWSNLNPAEKEPFNRLAVAYKEHLMREQPAVRWRRQQPQQQQHKHEQQQVQQLSPKAKPEATETSRGSSGTSSPEPPSSAPKPFKERYLALAEQAKSCGGVETSTSSPCSASDTKNACEALLQLAEGGDRPTRLANGNPFDSVKEFSVLRTAVWNRVAHTLMTQDKEKGNDVGTNSDGPINLSSQCSIHGQTIIEHIIENILNGDDNSQEKNGSDDNHNHASMPTEQIKEKIYQSLKEDLMRRSASTEENDLAALWNRLPTPTDGGDLNKNGLSDLSKMLPSQLLQSLQSKPAIGRLDLPEKVKSAPASKMPSPRRTNDPADIDVVVASSEPGSVATSTPPINVAPSVSVTLVPAPDLPLNLSTTPPQTPGGCSSTSTSTSVASKVAVTITTASPTKRRLLDSVDEDDDIRRSSRACKGRRYQEFKDSVGRKGRKMSGKSASDAEDDEASPPKKSFTTNIVESATNFELSRQKSSANPQGQGRGDVDPPMKNAANNYEKFDLERALTAIPALRPEEFQKRIQVNRQMQRSPSSASTPTDASVPISNPAGQVGAYQRRNVGGRNAKSQKVADA